MTTRIATANDYPCVQRMLTELGSGDILGGAAGFDRFTEILNHPGTSIHLSQSGDVPVAMAVLHVLPNLTFDGRPYALIENVVTLKSHRGNGHGRAVMQSAINTAWDAHAYKIMLLTGRAHGARGFYESMGFDPDEKHAMTLRRAPKRRPN